MEYAIRLRKQKPGIDRVKLSSLPAPVKARPGAWVVGSSLRRTQHILEET